MRAIEIYSAIDIEAAPEAIWPYLVDWENLGLWMKEGKSFEVTSAEREGVGVEASAVISVGGLKTTDVIRVTRWEPPETLALEHLGWVKGEGLMRCFPTSSGTHLYWKEKLMPPWGVLGAIGIRIFKPLMRRIFARDLRLLKELVES